MAGPHRSKRQTLHANGTLNPHAERVHDALFQSLEFFDPADLLQVKYEMLRRVQSEGWAVSRAAEAFGLSRPSFYKAQQAFEQAGLSGLVRQKPGPKSGHKLSEEVMAFIAANLQEQPALSARQLAQLVARQFNRSVHPRSVERALRRQEKKRSETP